jgi:3-hydroxybutyryl-CoA dehydratase
MSLQSTLHKSVTFRKTVSESDVYLFAGITGDLSPNHVDEEFMAKTRYGKRIVHGALLVGYMSGSSTDIVAECREIKDKYLPLSLGYDRIRFLKPVFIGDTIAMRYVIETVDDAKGRTTAAITLTNQHGETVAVATHIMKWQALDQPAI